MSAANKGKKIVQTISKWKILRGDTVELLAGRDKGKQGVVAKVLRKENRVLVEGLNLVKKHVKGTEQQRGGIFSQEAPVHVSNVSLVDPDQKVPTRVSWRYLEDGSKVRVSKLSGQVIPRPEILKQRRKPHADDGPKNTPASVAIEKTFDPSEVLQRIKISDIGKHVPAGISTESPKE